MKNTRFEGYLGPRLSRQVQLQRVRRVIREELTDLQREVLTAYYFQDMSIPQIARLRGVNKSSVCRALKRAEKELQKYLKY